MFRDTAALEPFFSHPFPVYFGEQIALVGTPEKALIELARQISNDAQQKVVRIVPTILSIEDLEPHAAMIVVSWSHVVADGRCLSSSTVRLFIRRTEDLQALRIEMTEYLDSSLSDIHDRLRLMDRCGIPQLLVTNQGLA
ncbi:hypothetical protein E4Z66_11215 [Aliishimia ponticola]|uniref:Uncharacterized protein n=1 Tax=Aliishimia ponticola TaxID=2499833 RepID=A0A4S4NC85_9RHOB|nr:hypothetical protein [Aliishimia ponticola]THH35658.1 hypothetical protein E4Z66_11215 [Aliishimia ponticola]